MTKQPCSWPKSLEPPSRAAVPRTLTPPKQEATARGGKVDIPQTEQELFSYLGSLTREVASTPLKQFTTTGLSEALSLSRNLASHYLNDLTRSGVVVKAGSRPVYYFTKRDLERYLQVPLARSTYDDVEELLAARKEDGKQDFDRLVGSDLSLASAIEKLKGAVKYPPRGLPVLICGEPGTGRSLLVSMMCEYGRRAGALPTGARVTSLSCGRFADDPDAFLAALDVAGSQQGAGDKGGIVFLKDVDRLCPLAKEQLAVRLSSEAAGTPKLALTASCDSSDPKVAQLSRIIPVIVRIPSLHERTTEEREELVLELLKEEGRRLGADVLISRTAFSCLVEAGFKNNIDGLRSCIISCCAAANLSRTGSRLEIQAHLLPGSVLAAAPTPYAKESELIDTTRTVDCAADVLPVRIFGAMLGAYRTHAAGDASLKDLLREVLNRAQDYEDYLAFGDTDVSTRGAAIEHVVSEIASGVNTTYGMCLSHKACLVISRCIHAHSMSGTRVAKWEAANKPELEALLSLLMGASKPARLASESLSAAVEATLGIGLGVTSMLFVFAVVYASQRGRACRQSVGIVLSHGYATATSIADAANRILRSHVYEAIDMTYDQQVSDVVEPLRSLLDRYSFCKEIAILVDMGSLEGAMEDLGGLANVTIGVVNNVSTGIALEIGTGLIAGEPLSELLPAATAACASRYRIAEAQNMEQAVVFCSEGGAQAAERIRDLVEQSIGVPTSLHFIAGSPAQLRGEGATGRYDVIAAIGTDNPGLEGVPFIALEDLISGGGGTEVDKVFSRILDEGELARFHQNLVKSLTLRNVIESITILNPERVLGEVEQAVDRLQELTGERLRANTMIGLCVHLCCLIERLITKSAIESYAGIDSFEIDHGDFVEAFQQSFNDITARYGVEVPMAEIAYAFDYIRHGQA